MGAPMSCAAAPPARIPTPWTAHRPDWATPKARPLVAGSSAATNAGAAAIWNAPPAPAMSHRISTTGSGGLHAQPTSGAQDAMASHPMFRTCADGAANLASSRLPMTVPRGTAAISRPTVTAVPPSECAYGAASPSGRM